MIVYIYEPNMRDYKGYEVVSLSPKISEDKLKKAVRSGKITLSADELKGNKSVLMHPMCAKLIKRAQAKGKGVTSMMICGADILYDIEFHEAKSLWNWLDGFKTKKAYNWIWEEKV